MKKNKNEALSPAQVNDIVADFENPIKGTLSGDTKDYVDTLKALAGFVSSKPNAHPKQVKDFLKTYKQDMQLKSKKPNISNPEKPSEPVKFGTPAAKQFQQQQTSNMPSLSSLAGNEKDWQQKMALPSIPDKKPESDSFKDLKTGDKLAATSDVGDLGKNKKPITPPPLPKKEPTKTTSTPTAAKKSPVKVKKSKSSNAEPSKPENDKKDDEKEIPSMSNIARAQRLVK